MQPGHGGNLTWAATLAGCSPSLLLDFSASINPLGPPASAIAAIQAHLGQLRHYPDPNYTSLRQALGQWHQLSPDWILPGNGVAELLTWIGRDLAGLDATYVVAPTFGDYLRALEAFNATVIKCPMIPEQESSITGKHRIGNDPSEYQSLASPTLPRSSDYSRSGLLLNNPHNPTGCLFAQETILDYLQQFALVVVDEAFMDFLPPDRHTSVLEWVSQYSNLIVLRSLTKFYSLPGLRIGYAIAHPDRLQRWQRWRDPWSVNTLAAAAAEAVIWDTSFQQQTWDWLAAARSPLFQALSALPGLEPFPSAANYLLIRCHTSVTELQTHLLKTHRVLIRDCLSFPELGDRYFRVAIRTDDENQRLIDALNASL